MSDDIQPNNLGNEEGKTPEVSEKPDSSNDNLGDYLDLIKKEYDVSENEDGINTVKIDDPEIAEKLKVEPGSELLIDENGNLKAPSAPPIKKDGEYIDISSSEEKTKNPFKKIARWFKKLPKKKKIIYSIIAIILCLVIILGTAAGIFIANKFNIMGDKFDETKADDTIYEEDDFDTITGDVGSSDFREALKAWATAGDDSIMKSKNVINVLLIGADSRNGSNEGNTDVMMLVSLNKKTKTVKMVSFLRDSYLYIDGKTSSGCDKLNAAYSKGGPTVLMTTIEHNYKIDIDNFVMVNFESFKAIVNAMGGITVDVQKYEANFANNKYNLNMPYGDKVTLTGEEALIFCRIRGCDADGDVSRTRRQRQVINSIMDEVKTSSVSDLNKYLDVILPYVYTGFSNSEILSLGMKAITGGWAGFERSQLQMPLENARTSGYAGSAWIWVCDYQLSAQTLQKELYGMTNIELQDGRTTLIDIYRGASSSSGSGSSSSGGSNNTPATTAKSEVSTTVPKTTSPATTVPVSGSDETTEVPTEITTEKPTEVQTTLPATTVAA